MLRPHSYPGVSNCGSCLRRDEVAPTPSGLALLLWCLGAPCYRAWSAVQSKTAGQHGDVAQLEEHLLCKQGVVGSSPIISTINTIFAAQMD